ncbi:MAG: TIGR03745 family integrating conjugative element membrane protein [Gammaproteobacteria bacterium]
MKGLTENVKYINAKIGLLGLSLFVNGAVLADLPEVSTTTTTYDDGDIIGMIKAYALDIFLFVGLVMTVVALVVVAKNTITTYSQVSDGRATMGQVGAQAAAGAVLVVFVVAILTIMSGVLVTN